jgi:hypothetical protein
MDAATLAGRLIGSAVIASGRPVAAAFAAQLVAAVAVHTGSATLPSGLAWVASPLALGVGLVAALVEAFVQHTDGADELLRSLHADKLLAALAGLPAMMVLAVMTSLTSDVQAEAVERLVATGLSEERASRLVDAAAVALVERAQADGGAQAMALEGSAAPETQELATAVHMLEDSQTSPSTKGILLASAFALQLAMLWIRGQVRELAEDVGLERVWAWLETGGLGVGVVLAIFAPFLMLGFAIAFAFAAFVGMAILRLARSAIDAARRRPCPACATAIRVEASRCPKCRAPVTPARMLGDDAPPATIVPAV